jgi:hypothetical protein
MSRCYLLEDGLSRLPPIKLKPEGDAVDEKAKPEEELMEDKTPRAFSFNRPGNNGDEDDEGKADDDNDDDLGQPYPPPAILPNEPTVTASPTESHPQVTISPTPPSSATPVLGDVPPYDLKQRFICFGRVPTGI